MKKPIRLGLIGCGGIVQKTHARAYHSLTETIKITALADVVTENLQKVGDDFDVPEKHRYADYRDMLAKGDIDAVTIATPHSLHAEQVIEAASAGVAIISEKPMATSLEEADTIMEAIKNYDVPYTVVHNYLYTAGMQTAIALLPEIGDTYYGRSSGMGLRSTDFNANHPNPAFAWRASRNKGGGCISDTSYHEIYSVCTLIQSPVRYVEARVKTMVLDIDVDDFAILLCEHENGTITTVSGAWSVPATDWGWCEVHAENGSLRVKHRYNVRDALQKHTRADGWKQIELTDLDEEGLKDASGHAGYFTATFNALAENKPLPLSAEKAYHNLAIIDAARRATTERRAIEI
ncbi:MAG: Gfo/Idh/MocA family oxidoreductase [Candidatus Poribacteria bacterium]|nr:Gfo/Idh/MocA family oxidoreductase [Candidatus Poribacteria bacterium]